MHWLQPRGILTDGGAGAKPQDANWDFVQTVTGLAGVGLHPVVPECTLKEQITGSCVLSINFEPKSNDPSNSSNSTLSVDDNSVLDWQHWCLKTPFAANKLLCIPYIRLFHFVSFFSFFFFSRQAGDVC